MEALLAEQPLIVSIMLGTLAFGLVYGWLQTGKRAAAVAGLICALLIPVVWVVASKWETDREQIETLIYQIADAVERNDHAEAVKVIDDANTRAKARAELNRWTFHLARVNRVRSINVIQGTFPLQADVEMSVKVDVSQSRGTTRSFRIPRLLFLKLQKEEDGWVVTDYRHMPMTGGPDRYSTPPTND